jgi:hypothetical protein
MIRVPFVTAVIAALILAGAFIALWYQAEQREMRVA